VGQPYEVRLVSFAALKQPAHMALQPFGQIPTYEEGDFLLPENANARARAVTRMFAALNTVEPPILELVTAKFPEGDKPWSKERLPLIEQRIQNRLQQLADRLGDADWLDGAFSGRPDDGVGATPANPVS
jgi:glutathione S-transferase